MTPFEAHAEAVANQLIFGQVAAATLDIIENAEECRLMVREYRDCNDPVEREVLRPVAVEAINERRQGNKQLQALADLLETQFGVSA